MKIIRWLSDCMSAIRGEAIVEVDENEIADIENMLILIDGDSVGHFGIDISLIGTDKCPELKRGKYGYIGGQFGYVNASEMKKRKRFYRIYVHRD